MKFFELGLTKLNIIGYYNSEMTRKVGEITAMYNPASISLDYRTDYTVDEFINSSRQNNQYQKARPGGLSLDLVFDASLPGNSSSVDDQLALLRRLCCEVDPQTMEPYFLKIQWGKMRWNGLGYFAGRMSSLNVRYTLFDRDGSPLRAFASLNLTADESLVKDNQPDLPSPDSVVTVPDMSNLPLIVSLASAGSLAAAASANFTDYLGLAYLNNLASLTDLIPGQPLRFPQNEGDE